MVKKNFFWATKIKFLNNFGLSFFCNLRDFLIKIESKGRQIHNIYELKFLIKFKQYFGDSIEYYYFISVLHILRKFLMISPFFYTYYGYELTNSIQKQNKNPF